MAERLKIWWKFTEMFAISISSINALRLTQEERMKPISSQISAQSDLLHFLIRLVAQKKLRCLKYKMKAACGDSPIVDGDADAKVTSRVIRVLGLFQVQLPACG